MVPCRADGKGGFSGWWGRSFGEDSQPANSYRPKGGGKNYTEQRLAELEEKVMAKEKRKEEDKQQKKAVDAVIDMVGRKLGLSGTDESFSNTRKLARVLGKQDSNASNTSVEDNPPTSSASSGGNLAFFTNLFSRGAASKSNKTDNPKKKRSRSRSRKRRDRSRRRSSKSRSKKRSRSRSRRRRSKSRSSSRRRRSSSKKRRSKSKNRRKSRSASKKGSRSRSNKRKRSKSKRRSASKKHKRKSESKPRKASVPKSTGELPDDYDREIFDRCIHLVHPGSSADEYDCSSVATWVAAVGGDSTQVDLNRVMRSIPMAPGASSSKAGKVEAILEKLAEMRGSKSDDEKGRKKK